MTTMIDPLRRALRTAPDAVAARCGDVEITYAQTWDRARRLVGALRGLGLGDGDRVAVVGRNCHRYLELYQAVPGAGMALVPLNQRHTAADAPARPDPTTITEYFRLFAGLTSFISNLCRVHFPSSGPGGTFDFNSMARRSSLTQS